MTKPVALIILDGWGIREMVHGNAVAQAETPNYRRWLLNNERSILGASGEAVGLPAGQMGNSEVGHLNLGAGRIVYQDITRIDMAIEDGSFSEIDNLQKGIEHARDHDGRVHLIGLLGTGGVHSHQRHLNALLDICRQEEVTSIVHVITDGRDTPPRSGLEFVKELESKLEEQDGYIASVSGRYYTMDRDKRWQRTQRGYRVIVDHEGESYPSAHEAIGASYEKDVTDEFIEPVIVETEKDPSFQPGDTVIFYNFRADRMRQIVASMVLPDFDHFETTDVENLFILTMTQYEDNFPNLVLFPDLEIPDTLAKVLSEHGKRQFHAAETEKYAHVTYFFNGGIETPYEGEERHVEPSPRVATYDLQPEMSAYLLTEKVLERLAGQEDDFILVNFANPDMVGHTGDLAAAKAAVEAVDECAGRLVEAIIAKGGVALVTADHGNAERMIEETTGQPHTYHTTNPVSFFALGQEYILPRPAGILADVAPTVLDLLGVEQPVSMTGKSLIEGIGRVESE